MAVLEVMKEPNLPSAKQVQTTFAAPVQLLGFEVTIVNFAIDLESVRQNWENEITAIAT